MTPSAPRGGRTAKGPSKAAVDPETDEATDERDDDYAAPSSNKVSLDPNQPVVFAGFDEEKLRAPLELGADGLPLSAKYTFAKLAMTSRTMPQTVAQAEHWFSAHIRERMEQRGFRVGWVRGDQALIGTRENPAGELIAFFHGPSSGKPALAWEDEATHAREVEVTELSDEPAANNPLLRVQREIAKKLARDEEEREQRLQKELSARLRLTRLPNKG